jgi:hypothetical protein
MADFVQYELRSDEGATLLVDAQADRVIVQQSSMGAVGAPGAAVLTAHEGHELARQIEAASQAAMSFKPPEAPTGQVLNASPAVQGLVEQLGPQGVAALVAETLRQMTPEQRAALMPPAEPTPTAEPTPQEAPAAG